MALLTRNGLCQPRAGLWREIAGTLLGAFLLALATPSGHAASSSTPQESPLQAVFLFNFAQFVEWPAQAFSDPAAPLVIGVLGQDPFGSTLDDAVRGETAAGRPMVVKRYRRADEIADCQIVFISASESSRLDR